MDLLYDLFKNKRLKRILLALIFVLPAILLLLTIFFKASSTNNFIGIITGSEPELIPAIVNSAITVILIIVNAGTVFIVAKTGRKYIGTLVLNIIGIVSLIFIGSFGKVLGVGHLIMYIIVLCDMVGAILYYFLNLKFGDEEETVTAAEELKSNYLITLILNVISTLALLTVFFIPIYTYKEKTEFNFKTLLLITGFTGTSEIQLFISFVAVVALYIVAVALTIACLKYYFHKDIKFSKYSKTSAFFNLGVSIVFFAIGTTVVFALTVLGDYEASSVSFIPFLILSVITIVHSFFNAKNEYAEDKKKRTKFVPKRKWLVLIFVTLFTVITFVTMLVTMVDISFKNIPNGFNADNVKFTCFDILINSSKYGDGFKFFSFFVFAILIISGIMYVLTLTAFFSKNGEIKRIGLTAVITNFLFVIALGLFGKYFDISLAISLEMLSNYFESLGVNITSYIDSPYKYYTVASQAFWMIFVDVAITIALLIMKPFTKLDEGYANGDIEISNNDDSPLEIKVVNDEALALDKKQEEPEQKPLVQPELAPSTDLVRKDACPAFTEIDETIPKFDLELAERKKILFENPTLPAITRFVVDFAREDVKNLTYKPQTIATFIAGLGATKLSILQGMSGTGKTSLPLIFQKALFSVCEPIEVESSWKDKNELLGYYNEFTGTYTPKSFTKALYTAALNPDVTTMIVLDEMNLSRIEYYFSDFLSLMEEATEKQNINLTNVKLYNTLDGTKKSYAGLMDDNHTLHIPQNVWFIGTANRDESTFEISDKVYDRAHTMNFNERAISEGAQTGVIEHRFLPYTTFKKLLDDAKANGKFQVKNYKHLAEFEAILSRYNISFGNRIERQINNFVNIYCACFPNDPKAEDYALESILLSKVVAKLEFKAIEDKEDLANKFKELELNRCAKFIEKLDGDF